MKIFQRLLRIDGPEELHGNRDDHYPAFEIRFVADGQIPFPQVIGPDPSYTGARVTADYLTAELPARAGDVRYYLEAEDRRGNLSRGALERIFLA